MTHIAISDEVASNLASAATARGCTQEDLASMLIGEALREQKDQELPPELESLLVHRIQQSERGECVGSEEVNVKFETFFQQLEAR